MPRPLPPRVADAVAGYIATIPSTWTGDSRTFVIRHMALTAQIAMLTGDEQVIYYRVINDYRDALRRAEEIEWPIETPPRSRTSTSSTPSP